MNSTQYIKFMFALENDIKYNNFFPQPHPIQLTYF